MLAADPRRVWQVDELLELSAAHPRIFEPGERYEYSNTNYNLLGLVIEEATGEPWREVVRERVIERLDLEHTSLPEPGAVASGSGGAHGYEVVDGRFLDFTDVDSSMSGAAGGHALVTSTEDLTRFLGALLAGELFERAETLDEMLTFVEATDGPGKVGHGLGIERYELPGGGELLGHVGRTAGYLALVGSVPAHDLRIAMVINSPDDPLPVVMPALELMLAEAS
jgi:D-alanyl-D-alanine carboxypeptidase